MSPSSFCSGSGTLDHANATLAGDFFGAGQNGLDVSVAHVTQESALAASTGVNLGLDDNNGTTELLSCGSGFFRGGDHVSLKHSHPVACQDLLGLVLVDLHV